MEPQIRLIHWYDTEHHRIACGAAGQSNSTKHVRGVTCAACLPLVAERRGAAHVEADGASYVH
jgi:hypothetical protein